MAEEPIARGVPASEKPIPHVRPTSGAQAVRTKLGNRVARAARMHALCAGVVKLEDLPNAWLEWTGSGIGLFRPPRPRKMTVSTYFSRSRATLRPCRFV